MATLITPTVIASRALATLVNTTVLAQLVNRDFDSEFTGKQGDTITVRKPATFTVDVFNRATGIVLQTPVEGSFTVTLDTLLDVSFPVTAEELTLKLDRFDERLLNPAMEAISQDVDGRLAEALVDAAESAGGGGTAVGTGTASGDQIKAFRKARRILGRNKIPFNERYAVLSPEGVEAVTGDPLYVKVNESGQTQALREGSTGRISGFDTYESQVFGFGPGDRGQAVGVAFSREAVALVSRSLQKPDGLPAPQVAVQNYKGLGLRVAKSYDINKKQDIISIDFLIGVSTIRKEASVQLDFGQGS
jgi:hypothetical protein